jgi:hypothetical protein
VEATAAILAAFIAGHFRMMGADEQRALVRMKRRRREPDRPQIQRTPHTHRQDGGGDLDAAGDRPLDTVPTIAGFAVAGE